MSETKKISFGFSKLTKRANLFAKPAPDEKNKVELIDCLEGQSIKIKDAVEVVAGPLIIPVQGSDKNLLDRVREANELKDRSRKKYEKVEDEEDTRPDSELNLDELAARQLLREAKNYEGDKKPVKVYSLPAIEDKLLLEGSAEPTVDDYENVPISEYGLAMLRGMGWKDGQGIGKTTSVTPTVAPELRPKGMGLGANKMVRNQEKPATDKDGKELSLKTGIHAKIIAGKDKGNYCTVQGLDDEGGRVIVKLALKGDVLSLNEFLLVPVTADEFGRCSKVLNNAKYEEFKEKSSSQREEQQNGKVRFENPKSSKEEIASKNKYSRSRSPEVRNAKNYSSSEKPSRKYRDSSSSSSRDRRRRDSSMDKKKKKKKRKDRRRSRSRKNDDRSSGSDERREKRKGKKKSKRRSGYSGSESDNKKSRRQNASVTSS